YEYASWDKKIVYISFGTVIILTAYRELLLYVRSSSCTNNLCWYDDLPWYEKKLKKITPFISIIFFGFALWFLHQELKQYEISEITSQLSGISNTHILLSVVISFLSYLVLTGYDGLGVKYIGEELEAGKII